MSTRITNQDQAEAWDGEEGDYWITHEARFEALVKEYSDQLHEAAHVRSGENVLDVGCGCGGSSRSAALAAAPGIVTGIDLSAAMLARARKRADEQGLTNLHFDQADAQVKSFAPESVDVILSRFGVMFFSDPLAAFRNLRRALRPEGRLVLLTWRGLEHNEWMRKIRLTLAGKPLPTPPPCAPGPYGFSQPESVRPILAGAGFKAISFTECNALLHYGKTREEAAAFIEGMPFAREALSELAPDAKQRARLALGQLIDHHWSSQGVHFQSSAWIIRASAA